MSLVEVLRRARAQPISILHEFKLYYDPNRSQVHAFVEGQPDKSFYANFIRPRLSPASRLFFYDCRGKRAVIAAMARLNEGYPEARTLLFFVDKDLDDFLVMQEEFDSLYCTEVYSIENYLHDPIALLRWFEENLQLRDVRFDYGPLLDFFDGESNRFIEWLAPIMAWILAHREAGNRPILSSLDLGRLLSSDEGGSLSRRTVPGGRLTYLDKVAQVATTREILRATKRWTTVLRARHPSTWLRGKFIAWFILWFIRDVEQCVLRAANEAGGSMKCQIQIHDGNLVEILATKIREPDRITLFLDRWLPYIRPA